MVRVLALFTAIAFAVGTLPALAKNASIQPAVAKKLHELGYPADTEIAVQKWRTDNGSAQSGPLTDTETSALLAQPLPEFLAAMVGNPFTGMGLAMRHKTRADAEREAIGLCKSNGGGTACTNPLVVRAEQCVAVTGYTVTIDRRPHYRTSVAVSTDMKLSMNAAKEACPVGATHPELCRPLLSFCGDGRELHVFDGTEAGEAAGQTAMR